MTDSEAGIEHKSADKEHVQSSHTDSEHESESEPHALLSDGGAVQKSLLQKDPEPNRRDDDDDSESNRRDDDDDLEPNRPISISAASLQMNSLQKKVRFKPDDISKSNSDQMDPNDIDADTSSSASSLEMTPTMWICFFSANFLIFAHRCVASGIYLVVPFYALEREWSVSRLSIVYGIYNFGTIVSSQLCLVAECFPNHRNTILFLGHCMQFVVGIIGFTIMSSIFGFNFPLFSVASFMVGMSADVTTVEAYGPLISDYEEFQMKMLGAIGKMLLLSGIIYSFALPQIYVSFQFKGFCFALCGVQLLAIVVLCILWSLIVANTVKETEEENQESQGTEAEPLSSGKSYTVDLAPSSLSYHSSLSSRAPRRISSVRLPGSRSVRFSRSSINPENLMFSLHAAQSMRDIFATDAESLAMNESVILSVKRRWSATEPTINEEAENTGESAETPTPWLTAPTLVLLLVVLVASVSADLYSSSFSLVLKEDFGISSEVTGYLDAAANVFSFLFLSVFLKLSSKSPLFQYPYDIILIAVVFVIGNVLFFVFYENWIAYSVHWILRRITTAMLGVQMVSRLYLCPPAAFNKVTSIAGMLKSGGYLSGAVLGPILFAEHHTLPFVVMAALNIMLIVVVVVVYVYRKRILSEMEFDDDIKGQYLLMERALNDEGKSAEEKELSKLEVEATRRMLTRTVTATDLALNNYE